MSNDAWDEEAMRLIHEASELIKPGEGEAVFYIRVGGPHTQCTVKAAAGVEPAKVIHAAIDVLNKEFADLKNCPVHTPQPSELVGPLKRIRRAVANPYDGGIWEGRHFNRSPFVTVRQSDMKAIMDSLERLVAADKEWTALAIRDNTRITQLEAQIAKLQADGDKLAGALEQLIKHTTWLESVAPPMCIDGKYMGESLSLADACQALTEWKDPKNA